MNFFDQEPISDTNYFFNILVVTIGIHPQYAEEYLGEGIEELVSLQKLTDARPKMFYYFVDDELDDDTEYEVEYYPHSVVGVSDNLGILWWDMIDFETDDPWRIDLDEDDFYY